MEKLYISQSAANYQKALARLQKSIRSGRFASYTRQKKQQIWNRLCRYARQLGIKIKAPLATACLAAGLCFASPAKAQTFVAQTGTANPLNSAIVAGDATPALVDIDNDGDIDAFIGAADGTISYYKNTGTKTAPVFTLQTGVNNPLSGVSAGLYVAPTFVDIDGDGDMDVFIGAGNGTIAYYKNTGTKAAPVFTLQTGANNPLNGITVDGGYATPTFVDIDGDGDMDLFIGDYDGTVFYYKNTGTATAPVFVQQTGTDNPLNIVNTTYSSAPTFADIDGDGDMDAIIGAGGGSIFYYKNTGTATAPVFALQTGAANPFSGITVEAYSTPAFADIDGDGDLDVFIGVIDGTVKYYENTTIILPLRLLSFSGSRQAGYNQLQWQTAAEVNTKYFEVERSYDGISFVKIAIVNTTGNASNAYSLHDNVAYSGKIFYRLKMVDADARFTYSPVIWINSEKEGGVSIYPNPVTNVVNINIGTARILKTNAAIYDAAGRLQQIILINNNQQQIDTHLLSKGMYVIKFADGTVQSFIKE